jgi:hypothetical protein
VFVAHGHEVAIKVPIFPVDLATHCAIKADHCSCFAEKYFTP